jgi:hypothetical protein
MVCRPECYGTTSDEKIRESGGMGIQRLRPKDWLEVMEKEKALGTGHLLPSFSMPRDKKIAHNGQQNALCA